MKNFMPFLLILLLLYGCASQPAAPASSASPSTQKSTPNWQYDLKKDGLYRTDRNTGDAIKINDQDYAAGVIITEDWVYFRDNKRLYRMDNENKRELVTDEKCWNPTLNNDSIYYINSIGIVRIKPDGSEKEQLLQCDCNWMVLTDQYIFYTLHVPEADALNSEPRAEDGPWYMGELHRVGLNGENDVKVADMIIDINVCNNIVYYSDGEDFCLYSINPETLEKTTVHKGRFTKDLNFGGGYAFFILDRHLFRMSLENGTMMELTHGSWDMCYGVLEGYVYVYINAVDIVDSGIYRIKLDGVELEKVSGYSPPTAADMFQLTPMDTALLSGVLTHNGPYGSGTGATSPYVSIFGQYEEDGKLYVICSVTYVQYEADADIKSLSPTGTSIAYWRAILVKNEDGTYICDAFDLIGGEESYGKELNEFCGPLTGLADKILNGDIVPEKIFPKNMTSLYYKEKGIRPINR